MLEPVVLATMLRKRFPHMTFLAESIECPYCHVKPGESCRTQQGRSADWPHMGRFDDFKAAVDTV